MNNILGTAMNSVSIYLNIRTGGSYITQAL